MNTIFKRVAILAFAGLTAISFEGSAQRRGGGGGGGSHSSGGGSRGGFGGGSHSSGGSRGSFGGGSHVSSPGRSSFGGGGQSARSFTPRSSGSYNRPAVRSNSFNRPSPSVRVNSYNRTTVRSNGFGGRSTVHNSYRPVGSYGRTSYNHTTVINRGGYSRGGYYGSPRVSYYHPSRPVYLYNRPHYGYYYHPYRPYYWGPSYHPVGFFTGALLGAAISLSWQNHPYRYYNGVYYEPYNSGYRVIAPPAGIRISSLPPGFSEIPVEGVNYYYYGGTFYRNNGGEYEVVGAPYGAVVYNLPDGAQEVTVNNNRYMFYNNTYYSPFNDNGTDAYEVVDVREQ